MSLRIHFTCDDLARTNVAPEPDPLWEVLLSLHLLQTDDDQPLFGRWRRHVRRRLEPRDRRLFELAPPDGYSPDFLTPAEGAEGLEQGLAAIGQTPADRLAGELERLVGRGQLSAWMRPGRRSGARCIALTSGFTGFAGQLHPDIRWSPPRLEVRGLIRTYRVGAAVRHTLSPTGAELVP